jgi:hypothetical protein
MAQHKDRTKRPSGGVIDFAVVPDELRLLKQWVMWRFDWSVKGDGSWAKVPYQTDGKHAESDNPDTWSTFDSVMVTYEQSRNSFDGIGFMFSPESGYVGVDVDLCITEGEGDLVLSPFANRVWSVLNTYTEISPSGTGIHCIGKARMKSGFNRTWKGNKVEGYSKGRYFTFTGRSWDETPRPIRDIQTSLDKIVGVVAQTPDNGSVTQPTLTLSVDDRLKIALKDDKCSSLFYGNTMLHAGDDSAADMALASKLAFYSGGDKSLLDAMFRQSKLMRPKWDEMRGHDTYGNITMDKAIQSCTAFFGVKKVVSPVKTESDYESRRLRRFTMSDLKDKAIEYYHNGQSRGVDPGWPELEPYYRPAPSMLTIVTGEPGSGKSNFIDCLCSKIALNHNWVFTFASFETLPIERHVLTLCQSYLRKPTLRWMDHSATENELTQAIDLLSPHFHFIMPDDHELHIGAILQYVEDDIKDYGIKGFVLDPFTELEQSRFNGQSQTEMIERILRDLQRFTRQRQIHTWLIAHPTKSGETYKDGRPTMRSISGSANFYNKADFGMVVHRLEDDKVTVYIDKVRFDSNGGRGQVEFGYSIFSREYMPIRPYESFVR